MIITVWYHSFDKGIRKFQQVSQFYRDKGAKVVKNAWKLSTGEMYNLFNNDVIIYLKRAGELYSRGHRTDVSYVDSDIPIEDMWVIKRCHFRRFDKIEYY